MKIDAELNPFEARVLYRTLWALQGSIDTMAAKAILCKQILGLRVTLSEEEMVQAGRALAEIIRKLGLVPGSVAELPLLYEVPQLDVPKQYATGKLKDNPCAQMLDDIQRDPYGKDRYGHDRQ